VNEQYPYWALPFLLCVTLSRGLTKWGYAIFSAIPLIYNIRLTPLYFLSPALVWNERTVRPLETLIQWIYPYANALGAMATVAFTSVCIWLFLVSARISLPDQTDSLEPSRGLE
jgi:hypothetical protein